jgi:biotin carboxylase
MKNVVLIVDPFSTGSAYANEFRKRGYEPICLISSKNLPERMKGQIDKNNYLAVFEDETECLEFIKNHNLKAVVSGSEVGVKTAERIGNKLGVLANDISIPDLRRNKFKMHEKLKEQGLNHIPSYLLSVNNIPFIPESKTGYVLKPTKSAASDGVIFIQNKEELMEKIHSLNFESKNLYGDKNNEYIAEPFIEGTEYVVDLVAFEDGSIKVASVCEYEKCEANNSKFVYKSLKVLNPKDYNTLIEYAINASRALGFKVGAIHMEIKNKEDPVMIEVGARMHGGVAPSLFEYCYKPPLLEASVDSYLGAKGRDAELIENGRIEFAINTKEGTALKLNQNKINDLQNTEGYKGHKIFFKEGDILPKTVDLATTPAISFLSHKNERQLNQSSMKARVSLELGIGI